MSNFVGIDLGTTNSAICTYDGEHVKIYKSPEQNDVTPSAIYIDRRSRYYGRSAYDAAARSPENVAKDFKRLMGTNTPIKFATAGLTMSPEECSAEILKVLYGYLPGEVRNDPKTGTVITVPAAFNQMQRDATLSASEISGIGNVALMQEPVAAVMNVMKARSSDGVFLIYDLGGGTFDIALGQCISKRVSLLDHGGIVMCGGRDFDRMIVDRIVKPWLSNTFSLPDNYASDPKYMRIIRLAAWAAERAKIELSMQKNSVIALNEDEVRLQDAAGKDMYLDIPLDNSIYDPLIEPKIKETIETMRELLKRAQLTPNDIERIVFIGGPTQHKFLRDMVSSGLGISADISVNPMTAVAEGAAIFAESIDWSSAKKQRKSARGSLSVSGKIKLGLDYISRTSDIKAQIAINCSDPILPGSKYQIDSLDTGWSSGRMDLKNGSRLNVELLKNGENKFKIFVFDPTGGPIAIENNILIITRTAATVDAIPSSHSIGVEVKDKMAGVGRSIKYLIKKGDSLPKKGTIEFRAAEALRAKGPGSINIKLWEGEIENPIDDNRPVGCLKITGADFDAGMISPGDKLICEFDVSDSGRVSLSISVPSVGGTFTRHDFYSRQDGEGSIDYMKASHLVMQESENLLERADDLSKGVSDSRLNTVTNKLQESQQLAQQEGDPEAIKQAMENMHEAKRLMANVRKDNLASMRQIELDNAVNFFNEHIKEFAKPTEIGSFEKMVRSAKSFLEDSKSSEFENIVDQIRGMNFQILWRQDWFIVDRFKRFAEQDYLFTDKAAYNHLIAAGMETIKQDKIDELRKIVIALYDIKITTHSEQDVFLQANILFGN